MAVGIVKNFKFTTRALDGGFDCAQQLYRVLELIL